MHPASVRKSPDMSSCEYPTEQLARSHTAACFHPPAEATLRDRPACRPANASERRRVSRMYPVCIRNYNALRAIQ